VVAAEVRTLASRTAQAARDIKQLIGESSARVASGTAAAGEARERMDEALQTVRRVDTALGEISTAAAEQQSGIAQINAAVAHLDSITQQNAALVEQLAAAGEALQGQVRGVADTMRLLRLAHGEASLSQIDAAALRRGRQALPG
jgi:aerotaxis receptor